MATEQKGTVYDLPLGGTVTIRGMRGHEEDILTDEKKVKSGEAIDEILKGCILEINGEPATASKIAELRSPDRLFCMVKIRQETYGDIVEYEHACGCKHVNYGEVDLSRLPFKERPEGDEFTIEIGGKKVTFTWLDGRKEKILSKEKNDVITVGMMLRIKEVEGVHPNGVRVWLKDLPAAERMKLRNAMSETDCGIQTLVEIDCEGCGRPNRFRVEGQSSFFFPNA